MKWGLHHTGDFVGRVWLKQSTQSWPADLATFFQKIDQIGL
jgi:hypothetical protein